MSELKKASDIQVGDNINTLIGYIYKVVAIEEVQKKFSTPERKFTVYSNIDDSKKLYEKTFSAYTYLTVVNDYRFPNE